MAIIGATGKAGSLILKEAADRGHDVTATVRGAAKVTTDNVNVIEKDIFDLTAADVPLFDVVVNSFGAPAGQEHLHVEAGQKLINILKETPYAKLIVVGGAGSLFVDEEKTVRVLETPDFPKEYLPTAQNQGENLLDLQKSEGIQWTFISPSAFFDPEGKRTGSYQSGKDNLLVNAEGQSYISYADCAIAVFDKIENPKHQNKRFTVVSN